MPIDTHHLIFKSFRESINHCLHMIYLLYRKQSYHSTVNLFWLSRPRAVKTVAVRLLITVFDNLCVGFILWPTYSILTTLDFGLDIWFKSWGYFKSHNLNIQICVGISFSLIWQNGWGSKIETAKRYYFR